MSTSKVSAKPSAALTRLASEASEAPSFVANLEAAATVAEGDPFRFSTQVTPVVDSSLSVEWYKDGKPLDAGSRFSTIFDRGYCVLDIYYTIAEDSGSYACVASSNSGSAQSSVSNLTVVPENIPESNAKLEIAMQNAQISTSPTSTDRVQFEAPKFSMSLAGGGQLQQGKRTRLEAYVEPSQDTSIKIEWLKDGQPISTGSRFNHFYDRGFCMLEILYCYPEDSGKYTCLARNLSGEAQSNAVEIICYPDESIVTTSHLDDSSLSQLKQFESSEVVRGSEEMRYVENVEADCPPEMAVKLQNNIATENGPVKFFVKIDGHPTPIVVWYINNIEVVPDSIVKTMNDGAINYLEIGRCSEVGEFRIKVAASNALGNVENEAVLTVVPSDFNVPDLKHITPDPYNNPYKKMNALKKVDCLPELKNAFQKPKPSAESIVNIERGVEMKGRHGKTADVVATEKLYDHVAANLRKSHKTSERNPSATAGYGKDQTQAAFNIQLED